MRRALHLARLGEGYVSPNPMVGAVIVKDNKIIGEGYHRKAGTEHAEIHALKEASHQAKGATLYVTLEPCSHFGRTPPCTEAIITAGIKKVIAACTDPNPKVAGNGLKRLREAGIEVMTGVLEEEAVKLNEIFNKYITTGKPFVSFKAAVTCDGKIATASGHSKWITNLKSRQYVHKLRHSYDAILVGSGTVLNDDPSLTTRLVPFKGLNPIRIILDGRLRTSPKSKVFTDGEARTILVTTKGHAFDRLEAYRKNGVEILKLPGNDFKVDINILLKELGTKEICSILIEGGAQTAGNFFDAKAIDKVYMFISSKVAGGNNAINCLGGLGIKSMDQAPYLADLQRYSFNEDTLIVGKLKYKG
ncbi:MAG: ribD [Clostridiales bacterium]|jgi:diaminohydroxyphosphoribosylaminopyrimidine deaminase/5-amino-6-(5-phosphoribosylamino)uracil reductase|nr:ribD [Clostridiales bacterium]